MALGKGLSSLIPDKREQADTHEPRTTDEAPKRGESVFQVEVERIKPNPHQPRREMDANDLSELAASIQEHGVLQPLIVTKVEEERETGRDVHYEIIAGERRWRAAQEAGLNQVPVIVRRSQEREKLELALIENLQRSDLNAIEEAEAYRQLMDSFGLSHSAIAQRVGKQRSTISNALRLLELPDAIQQAVRDETISMGHARALLGVSSPARRQEIFTAIVEKGLSVRDVERLVREASTKNKAKGTQQEKDPKLTALEEELSSRFGTDVEVTQKRGGKGRIVIRFYSDEELDAIRRELE